MSRITIKQPLFMKKGLLSDFYGIGEELIRIQS